MQDETIREGDLVVVVKPCTICGDSKHLGEIRVVKELRVCKLYHCHAEPYDRAMITKFAWTDKYIYPVHELKKIHPPEQETTTTKEKELCLQ